MSRSSSLEEHKLEEPFSDLETNLKITQMVNTRPGHCMQDAGPLRLEEAQRGYLVQKTCLR